MTESSSPLPRWIPGPLTLHVAVLGAILFAATLAKGPWDSDYFWHVRTGRYIAEGAFPRTDPFSFTWGGMPWTLHEWLGELLIYRLVDGIGYVGAVIVFAFIPGIVVAILAYALHRRGLRTGAVMGSTVFVALLVIPYVTLRPQALSWILLALLVGGILHLNPERARWSVLLVPFFVVWANLHGLWVVGLVVLAAFVVMSLLGMTSMAGARAWTLALVPLAMAGTLFTPEGPALLTYPLRYVDGADWGMANITEWQSPDFHDPAHIPLLVYMAGVAVFARWRVPWWMSMLAFMGVAMTLLALRNGPVAAILGAPALATGLDAALTDWRGAPRIFGPRIALRRRILEVMMAALVGIAGFVIFLPPDLEARIEASIDRELPVQGVELLAQRVPDGRIIAEYGWGGYVIGQLHDLGGRVMVDGRNDMYDEAILDEYTAIQNAADGWVDIVERYAADAMIFPPYRAITTGPAEDAGWCEVYRDDNEVVYLRDCDV